MHGLLPLLFPRFTTRLFPPPIQFRRSSNRHLNYHDLPDLYAGRPPGDLLLNIAGLLSPGPAQDGPHRPLWFILKNLNPVNLKTPPYNLPGLRLFLYSFRFCMLLQRLRNVLRKRKFSLFSGFLISLFELRTANAAHSYSLHAHKDI